MIPTLVWTHVCVIVVFSGVFGVELRDATTWRDVMSHFTVWSWFLFIATLAGALPPIVVKQYWAAFTVGLFCWSFGTVCIVITLLVTMTLRDPNVILQYGHFGLVFFGDKLLHGLPLVVLLAFLVIHKAKMSVALGKAWNEERGTWNVVYNTWNVRLNLKSCYRTAVVCWVFLSPAIFVAIYAATHNLLADYGSTMPTWMGAVVVVVTLLLTQSTLLWALLRSSAGKGYNIQKEDSTSS